jgi:hypothetical protein
MQENVQQSSLFGSSSGSSRDDIGWYTAVRDGLIGAYIIPANTNFLAQLCAIHSRGYSDCGSEGRECVPLDLPSDCNCRSS